MFFVLSKLLLIFILPFTWVLVLFIFALVSKKPTRKQRYLISAFVLLLIFTNSYILNSVAHAWDINSAPLQPGKTYSCAILLGGFSSEDANGNGYFTGASDRFIQALKLYHQGKVSHILVSGANGYLGRSKYIESEWTKSQLMLFHVPDSCIIVEGKSRNTIENAAYSKILLTNSHLQPPYILVTSAFHMRRSLGIFKNTGVQVIPYSSNYMAGNTKYSITEILPDIDALTKWNFYVKEMVGSFVNYLRWHL
jgi:uncharacterized SAM-binding protein YcdF (DUF218 family)